MPPAEPMAAPAGGVAAAAAAATAVDPQRMRARSRAIELHRRLPLKHTEDLQPLLEVPASGLDQRQQQQPKEKQKKPPPIPTPPIFINARYQMCNYVPYKPPEHYVCWNQRNGATLVNQSDFYTATHRDVQWLRRYLPRVSGDPNNLISIPVASALQAQLPSQNESGLGGGASSITQGLAVLEIEERVRRMRANQTLKLTEAAAAAAVLEAPRPAESVSSGAGLTLIGSASTGASPVATPTMRGDVRVEAQVAFLADIPLERLAAMEALIELFEKGAGLKNRSRLTDCSREYMLQLAKSDAADKLGVAGKFVSDVYNYWIGARKDLKKPLLRVFQPPPQPENPSPHVAFRPRQSSRRISTRHPKRNDIRDVRRLRALQRDFQLLHRLVQTCKQREHLKIAQVQLSADRFYNDLQHSQLGLWVAAAVSRKPVLLTPSMLLMPSGSPVPTPVALGCGPFRAGAGELFIPAISSTVIQLLSFLRSPVPSCRWGFDVHLRPGLGGALSGGLGLASGGMDRGRKRHRRSRTTKMTKHIGFGGLAEGGFDAEDEWSEATEYSENSDDDQFFAGLERFVSLNQLRAAQQPLQVLAASAAGSDGSQGAPMDSFSPAAAPSPPPPPPPPLPAEATEPLFTGSFAGTSAGAATASPRRNPSPPASVSLNGIDVAAAAAAMPSSSSSSPAAVVSSHSDAPASPLPPEMSLERLERDLQQATLAARGVAGFVDLQAVLANPHVSLQAALADAAQELEVYLSQRGQQLQMLQQQQLQQQQQQQQRQPEPAVMLPPAEVRLANAPKTPEERPDVVGAVLQSGIGDDKSCRMVLVDSDVDGDEPPPLAAVAVEPRFRTVVKRPISSGRSSTSEDDYSSQDDDFGFPFSMAPSPSSTEGTLSPPDSPSRGFLESAWEKPEREAGVSGAAAAAATTTLVWLPDGTQLPLPPAHYAYGLFPPDDDNNGDASSAEVGASGQHELQSCFLEALRSSAQDAPIAGKLGQLIQDYASGRMAGAPLRLTGRKRGRLMKDERPAAVPGANDEIILPLTQPDDLGGLLKQWMWTGGYSTAPHGLVRKRQRRGFGPQDLLDRAALGTPASTMVSHLPLNARSMASPPAQSLLPLAHPWPESVAVEAGSGPATGAVPRAIAGAQSSVDFGSPLAQHQLRRQQPQDLQRQPSQQFWGNQMQVHPPNTVHAQPHSQQQSQHHHLSPTQEHADMLSPIPDIFNSGGGGGGGGGGAGVGSQTLSRSFQQADHPAASSYAPTVMSFPNPSSANGGRSQAAVLELSRVGAAVASAADEVALALLAAKVSEKQLSRLQSGFAMDRSLLLDQVSAGVSTAGKPGAPSHLLAPRVSRGNRVLVDACRINPNLNAAAGGGSEAPARAAMITQMESVRRGRRRRQPPAHLVQALQ